MKQKYKLKNDKYDNHNYNSTGPTFIELVERLEHKEINRLNSYNKMENKGNSYNKMENNPTSVLS